MKKFRLELDDLRIDSFSTTPAQAPKGTVFGEQCTCYTNCTCPGCPTCDASCNGTCDASCNGTCYTGCRCPVETDYGSCAGTCDGSCDGGYTCGGGTYGGPREGVCELC
jgi:hypothetical protein